MQLDKDDIYGQFIINQYNDEGLVINGGLYTHSLIISAHELLPWTVTQVAQLNEETFTEIIKQNPDVVLLGVGNKPTFISAKQLAPLLTRNIAVEVMANNAACRTFMALLAERRKVLLAIIL